MKSFLLIFLLFFSGLILWWVSSTTDAFDIPPEPPEQRAEMVSNHHALFEGVRSGKWPSVRQKFIQMHPSCEACGSTKSLNVHHIFSFKDHPELELDHDNLITLCRTHHFLLGHSSNWANTNEKCKEEVRAYRRLYP